VLVQDGLWQVAVYRSELVCSILAHVISYSFPVIDMNVHRVVQAVILPYNLTHLFHWRQSLISKNL